MRMLAKDQNLVSVGAECLSEGASPSELLRRAGASVVGRSGFTAPGQVSRAAVVQLNLGQQHAN